MSDVSTEPVDVSRAVTALLPVTRDPLAEELVRDRMRHYGYTDEQIELAEAATHEAAGCTSEYPYGWVCANHQPLWADDKVARMLGIAHYGCPRCGNGAIEERDISAALTEDPS